jgi:hypothetical protein
MLASDDFETRRGEWVRFYPRQVINPLLSFLYSTDELVKYRAVTAIGVVMAFLAEQDMESCRVIMRRLMWSLNDESGGIGWGAPEAMGEIMASQGTIAREFAHILLSYICEDGNLLEHEDLQRGVLWGLCRIAQVRPHLLKNAPPRLIPFLKSHDPAFRGLAAWNLGLLRAASARSDLHALSRDDAEFSVFVDGEIRNRRVGDVAAEAVKSIDNSLSKTLRTVAIVCRS